jgi:hypothetical protein
MRGDAEAMDERTTEMTRLKGFSYDQHASVSLGPLKIASCRDLSLVPAFSGAPTDYNVIDVTPSLCNFS